MYFYLQSLHTFYVFSLQNSKRLTIIIKDKIVLIYFWYKLSIKTIMKIFKALFIIFMTLLLCSQTWAQGEFSLTADVRSRFEYRHGFSTLFPDDADPAAFVNQRTKA